MSFFSLTKNSIVPTLSKTHETPKGGENVSNVFVNKEQQHLLHCREARITKWCGGTSCVYCAYPYLQISTSSISYP